MYKLNLWKVLRNTDMLTTLLWQMSENYAIAAMMHCSNNCYCSNYSVAICCLHMWAQSKQLHHHCEGFQKHAWMLKNTIQSGNSTHSRGPQQCDCHSPLSQQNIYWDIVWIDQSESRNLIMVFHLHGNDMHILGWEIKELPLTSIYPPFKSFYVF